MKVYDKEDVTIPYVILEFDDTFEKVKEFAYEHGAILGIKSGDDLYHIQRFGKASMFLRENQLKECFPVPQTMTLFGGKWMHTTNKG